MKGFLKPLNTSFEKEDAVKTGRFLLYFLAAYLLLYVFVNLVVPVEAQEVFVANNAAGILNLLGQKAGVALTNAIPQQVLIRLESGPSIEISDLCTGTMEVLIIVSAIIASVGISWRRRLIGAALGAIATAAFNYVRIVATTMVIVGSNDLATVELAHNLLFRIFLFVTIAGIYIAWFYWAVSSEGIQGKSAKDLEPKRPVRKVSVRGFRKQTLKKKK